MKKLFKVPEYIFRVIYFLIALSIVLFISFFFGRHMLGPGLPGSDNSNFVTLAAWLYNWFPNIPFWYPQQGAGVSFTTYYPILNHLIVVIIAKLFSLSVLIAFRYYALISVGLTSIGIYFLAARFTRNQTVAGLASIFYALSPIAWTLMMTWGFFAEHASYVFIAPAIIFFELTLVSIYQNKLVLRNRIFLLLFLVFSVLTLLAHPLTFIGLISLLIPFILVYPLAFSRSKKLIVKSIKVGAILLGIVIILSLFFLLPYYRYQKIVSQGAATGKMGYSRPLMLQNSIYFKTFFNIDPTPVIYKGLDDKLSDRSAYGWHNVAFPIAVSVLALIGFVGSFIINRKLFALAFANLFSLAIALLPDVLFFFFQNPILNFFGNWRAMIIPSRLIIPILAGFGCYTIAYFATFPLKYLSIKIRWRVVKFSANSLFILTSSILTIAISLFALYYFRNWPDNPSHIISYGPEAYYTQYKPDLRNLWGQEIDYCNAYTGRPKEEVPFFCANQDLKEAFWLSKISKACDQIKTDKIQAAKSVLSLCSGNIERAEIDQILKDCMNSSLSEDLSYVCKARVQTIEEQMAPQNFISKLYVDDWGKKLVTGDERKLIEKLPDDSNSRVDVSPGVGTVLMALPYYSNIPELGVYYNQSSLIPLMWNYAITAFYSNSGIWGQPQIVDELVKYFGIGYTFLSETNIPIEKYEENWERLDVNNHIFGVLGLWKYKYPTGLITATTKPTILVIGDIKSEAYFRIFHLANIGGIRYDQAILVDGGEHADNLPLSDLKKFDAVIMDGYKYKNRGSAWRNLDQYVKSGGRLFINTGWQYVSADWQNDKLPEFFPMSKLVWTDAGMSRSFDLDGELTKGIESQDLSPLIYGDKAWNISSTDKTNLRSWAREVVSVQGRVIVAAGSYGDGKVVWTGLDLPGHIGAYEDNPSEIKLYNNLISYLLEGKSNQDLKVSFTRSYPDKVEFTFAQDSDRKTAVYWREAYYPDFKAKFLSEGKKESLRVFKAGPGLTMFMLPRVKSGSKIIYEYKTPFVIFFARLISLAALFGVILFVVRPKILVTIKDVLSTHLEKTKIKNKISASHKDEHLDY